MMNAAAARMMSEVGNSLLLADLHFNQQWSTLWILLLVAAIAGLSVWLYRGERDLSRGLRFLLGGSRLVGLALLLLILLEPTIRVRAETKLDRHLIVMVDTSESMGISDTRKTHEDLLDAALATGEVPYEQPERRRLQVRAQRHMTTAIAAIEANDVSRATKGMQQAELVLQGIVSPRPSNEELPASIQQAVTQVREILARQEEVRKGSQTADLDAERRRVLMDEQRKLAARLSDVRLVRPAHEVVLGDKAKDTLSRIQRLDMVKALLSDRQRNVIRQIEDDYDITYCRFDESVASIAEGREVLSTEALDKLKVSEKATHLGSCIEQAVHLYGGPLVAGVVVFTDGVVNGGDGIDDVGNRMGQRAIPIYPVGIGLPSPDDIAIRNIVVQDVAFSGDTVPVRVQIHSNGYEKRETYLRVLLDGRQVKRQPIVLKGGAQFEDIFFDAYSPEVGAVRLEIAVEALPNEATIENNRVQRTVRMIDQKIRVLFIEGTPRWEYRYLMAILKRDPRIDVRFINTKGGDELARVSREHIARFPSTKEEAYSYDLVVLGDVAASFFEEEELLRLEELVRDRGGSLVMLAGRNHTPFEYADTPIARMLPVRFDRAGTWEDIADTVHPVLTTAGKRSMVMVLESPEEQNSLIWARVKPLTRVPPIIDAKPGAVVLAELSDSARRVKPYPLIAWQRYGSGKTLFIGTDRLWRLRFKSGDKYHWRLWSQTIQFLTLSRLLGEHQRVRIQTDRTIYRSGERVHLYANVLNDVYEPVVATGYPLYVEATGETKGDPLLLTLKAEPGKAGLYQGYFTAEREGAYRIVAPESDRSFANVAEFNVSTIRREMTTTQLNEDALRKLARASGGQYFKLADLPTLPEAMRGEAPRVIVEKEHTLWDRGWVLFVFVGLVGLEWFLRRKNDLA